MSVKKHIVRVSAEKSKHNLENSNKYEIMYKISNIYHKNEVLPLEKKFSIFVLQLQLQVNDNN